MKLFKLPDLGEGLPDAIIREWHVDVGDQVALGQPLVSMETAKALVDIPAPYAGVIAKRFGQAGDTMFTGQPLLGFEGEEASDSERGVSSAPVVEEDQGTVVGALEVGGDVGVPAAAPLKSDAGGVSATPAVRALARRLGVSLSSVVPQSGQRITVADVRAFAADMKQKKPSPADAPVATTAIAQSDMQSLSPARRAMCLSMTQSHREVVPVTLSDQVDISTWKGKENVTLRVIRAIQDACQAEPMLNVTFDAQNQSFHCHSAVHLGLAIDAPHGLYVPVLRDIAACSDSDLREQINRFKRAAQDKTIAAADLHGATLLLSNFGTIAGRYATPIVQPPMTATVGIGRLYDAVIPVAGETKIATLLPLSVTADHRVVTGGEMARFLQVMMQVLMPVTSPALS